MFNKKVKKHTVATYIAEDSIDYLDEICAEYEITRSEAIAQIIDMHKEKAEKEKAAKAG